MYNEERIEKLKEDKYQEIFGVKKFTFDKMLEILENQYKKEHLKGGRPPKLSVLDKLVIMLSYKGVSIEVCKSSKKINN